jgi:hypothetical protein
MNRAKPVVVFCIEGNSSRDYQELLRIKGIRVDQTELVSPEILGPILKAGRTLVFTHTELLTKTGRLGIMPEGLKERLEKICPGHKAKVYYLEKYGTCLESIASLVRDKKPPRGLVRLK